MSSSGMKMTDTRKGQNNTHYEHTSRVLERRRSLFPSDVDSEDSDLGHISPLPFDSDSEEISYLQEEDNALLLSKADSINDYDILGVVEQIQGSICTPINVKNYAYSDTMSPLYISPCLKLNENTVMNDTPSKMSPIYKLKTPHDTCNTNSKLPKLVRKSLLDSSESSFNKRQLSPYSSPEENKNKYLKLDPKVSKVRTTLFPEIDITFPTKSFYPKTEFVMDKILKKSVFTKSPVSHNSTRRVKTRKQLGQINAGVGHKIRKPKQKTTSKLSLVKATMSTANKSAINDYISDLKQLNSSQSNIKLIENKENKSPHPVPKIADQVFPESKLIENNSCPTKTVEESNNKKRPLSPLLEPDPKKKFFKFSRGKGVVTVNKNIKVQVDHGKMTLIEKEKKKKIPQKIDYDSSDLNVDEPLLPNIDNILSSLENDSNDTQLNGGTKIVLQASNTVSASENSILLHPPPTQCTANLILSPISQMCDVTSGLALNSPKKVKNLTSILNEMSSETLSNGNSNIFNKQGSSEVVKQKLFPIFCNTNTSVPEKRESKGLPRTAKKFKNLEESQMLIDAGQKKFGVTQCPECSIVYHIGDPSDENMHLHYHNAAHVLKFAGWRNEKVVADFLNNGRIIQIAPGDSKFWWKKVKDLMDVINRELGCFEMEFCLDNNCQVFLYIKSRTIAGCVVAIPKEVGHRMLATQQNEADMCSEKKYPIKCGIPRIWVSHNRRNEGIASALMNAVKKNFLFGHILNNDDIALSPPTEMGKNFAKNYFKTPNYLIYYE